MIPLSNYKTDHRTIGERLTFFCITLMLGFIIGFVTASALIIY